MTIIDRGCWERGCACYDSRIADETVEVVEKRPWVGLTDEEYIHITDSVYHQGHGLVAYYKAIEAKLKEKNT
jgi:hypothetical protein